MRLRNGTYLPKDSIFPFGGLSLLEPTTQLDPRFSPVFHNLLTSKGLIQRRKGYTAMDSEAMEGTPLALVSFQAVTGTTHLVCFTTTKQYEYNSGTSSWDDITGAATGWTGDTDDVVSWTSASGTQGIWLIATNGKDEPIYWDGTGTFAKLSSAAGWAWPTGTITTCKSVAMFYSHLVLGGVETSLGSEPLSYYWSDTNSLVEFVDGTAGSILVTDAEGVIEAMVPLGDRLMTYFTDSVGTLTYVGGEQIYLAETLIRDLRLLSPRAIANVGSYHLVMRKESISLVDGTRMLRDISDPIWREYKDMVSPDHRKQAYAFLDRDKNQVWFYVPTGDKYGYTYILEFDQYDLSRLRWSKHVIGHYFLAMTTWPRVDTLAWDSASLSGKKWSDLALTWRDANQVKNFANKVGVTSAGNGMLLDELSETEAGGSIWGIYESPDFVADQEHLSVFSRWTEVEVEFKGEINLLVCGDGTWGGSHGLRSEGGEWKREKVDIDVVSRMLRVRIFSSTYFELRWLRVWSSPREAR